MNRIAYFFERHAQFSINACRMKRTVELSVGQSLGVLGSAVAAVQALFQIMPASGGTVGASPHSASWAAQMLFDVGPGATLRLAHVVLNGAPALASPVSAAGHVHVHGVGAVDGVHGVHVGK